MPFPAILRSTLLISSVLAASSYALYQSNPQFRAFIDNTINRITSAWDDLLASLSPEERQRQREAQRRELAIALESRQRATTSGNNHDAAAIASGSRGVSDDGKARRRNLWEVAEKNAERLKRAQDGKKPFSPVLKTVAPIPVDESVEKTEKALPPLPQSSITAQRSVSSAPPPPPKDDAAISQSQPARAQTVDPVIALLVEEAGTDPKLRDLMSLVSSGEASDAQLGEFASRIHFLDENALQRNEVDPNLRIAPPPYEDLAQVSEEPSEPIIPMMQVVAEPGHVGPQSETTTSPLIQPKQEGAETADASRFQSTTMLQMFPELTEPHAAHSLAENSAARDPPISVPPSLNTSGGVVGDHEDDGYSTILTPTSPSLQSVSDADTEPASHISELVSEAGEDTHSHHGGIDNDTMSLTSDTSWITGVSEANSANSWEGLDDPAEVDTSGIGSARQ